MVPGLESCNMGFGQIWVLSCHTLDAGTCTDYESRGCAMDCDNGGCSPNACFTGNC